MKNLLILCTGNSARSILGEAIARTLAGDRLSVHSAGSKPKGEPHPEALRLLAERNYSTEGLHSKSWDVFTGDDVPPLDMVITVCDGAARESCPIWPGAPVRAHWGIADPVAAPEDRRKEAFERTFDELYARIAALLALPFENMPAEALGHSLNLIGERSAGASEMARAGPAD